MKVYHGTSIDNLNSILSDGLKPRKKKKGNWKDYPSRTDMVYLTTAYAPFFAASAGSKETFGKGLILEIDYDQLDPLNLYPDEDFVAQAISHHNKQPLNKVHKDVKKNLKLYQHVTIDSLDGIGNISHCGGIKPSAISRYCIIDFDKRSDLVQFALDASISLINYRFMKSKYISFTSWLFGDCNDFQISITDNESYFKMVESMLPNAKQLHQQQCGNREGIVIFKPIVPYVDVSIT